MEMDENRFFREVTLRICSSLDIEIAMWRAMQFLGEFMPADEMYLHLYEGGLGAMRTIAGATASHGRKMDRITPLPPAVRDRVREPPDMLVINRPEGEPGLQFMLQYYGRPDTSALVRLLEVEGRKLGALVLLASGMDRFTQAHARLFSLLKEPFSMALSNALKHQETLALKEILADDNRYLQGELLRLWGDEIVGADLGLRGVMALVERVAPLQSPVLLLGETGVGKDVIANAIHRASPRRDGPLVKVNCGAIPETLLDSELFGHERGAFTGAVVRKRGRFERAHRGTLFLDEIGELSAQAQVRMLRVLQHREIERVGGTQPVSVDIRLIAATNRDLEAMVGARLFRQDLWFRLNVFPIRIPPLRERRGDIPALVHHLVRRKCLELKLFPAPPLATGVLDRLVAYDWPGNVRELENVLERALIVGRGESLDFQELAGGGRDGGSSTPSLGLDAVISHHIRRVLDMANGRVHGEGGAAQLLEINPSTLRHRMNQLGIPYGVRARKGARTP
jgi:transcriptional regulator with GAF, ATPase, and Fis domain